MEKKSERKSRDMSEGKEEKEEEEEEEQEQDDDNHDDESVDDYTNVVINEGDQVEEIYTYCDQDVGIDKENESPKDPVEYKMRKKRALMKFKTLVEDAISKNYLVDKPKKLLSSSRKNTMMRRNNIIGGKEQQQLGRDITLWGVPLLPSKGHEGTEIVLLKFLKANHYKVHSAFYMLRKVMKWRKEYKTDSILDEDLLNHNHNHNHNHDELKNVVHTGSMDKQGHPLYYTVYGAFKDKSLCTQVLGTEESRENFLRLKVQYLEKSIKQLSFKSGGVDSIVQITDLKNFPAPMKELTSITKRIVTLFQSNYPGIINKNILINVPFWYYTSRVVTTKLMNPRARKKFILARPSNVTQTLLKYISIEQVPTQYGGLKRENDAEFLPEDKALECTIRANAIGHVNIPVTETGVTIIWDYTVVGWDVAYKEQFIPDDEGSYSILLRGGKAKRSAMENARNSCYVSEPGKIVITIENSSYARKKVYYRFKTKPISIDRF